MTSVSDIRKGFLSFFETQDHTIKASAPLVPENDPSLLFVNAGMVPFKNIFTGAEKPFAPRAATSQKCVRAGGKHNDLDNVGYTARHHTFFEMLGNFSFGDYFKEEAISHAWSLITKDFALPKDKLLVTVYHEDDEAFDLWKRIAGLPDEKIIRIATSDNFWSMGDTGPCGPCSEIFYDHGDHIAGGPPGSPDEDGDRFIEIWNLVFMQFNQLKGGARENLPKPSIDTGMGLERLSTILQGVHNNYDIDLFQALIAAEEEVFGVKRTPDNIASFRVIADHLRSSAFLMADGVIPSNEGRGYVLRRIMRRAMRHAHILGATEPLMHKLTSALTEQMGEAFPELSRADALIHNQLEQEETRFQRTLGRGLALLEEATAKPSHSGVLPGDIAFKLYDTYGFPLDLTQDVLRAKDMTVDVVGYDSAMTAQKEGGKEGWKGSGDSAAGAVYQSLRDRLGPTRFTGYENTEGHGEVLAILENGTELNRARDGSVEIVLDETPFYAESGGQAGDHGKIAFASGAELTITDVQKRAGDIHVHIGELSGDISVGDKAKLSIDTARRAAIKANHSATHIMHTALRNVLGTHVTQKGSLVEADRLRFDFSHGQPMTKDEMTRVEDEVNAVIRQNDAVSTREMAPEAAIEEGALALFGEKYGEIVRVLTMGRDLADRTHYSMEFCGGTHVTRTGDIALFKIVSEGGVSSGIRRIEAMTGLGAFQYMRDQAGISESVAGRLKTPVSELEDRVLNLVDQRKSLEKELSEVKRQLAMGGGKAEAGPEEINGTKLIGRVVEDVPAKDLRALIDEAKQTLGSGVAAFIAVNDGKAAIAIGVTSDLTDNLSAVDLVKAASSALGGKGGGGRPDMAQAGGPDGSKADEALAAIKAAMGT